MATTQSAVCASRVCFAPSRSTGKERDAESGLDYFFARFMTPDWAAAPTAVPYASFGDPQTLNLYSYVENAPLNRVDAGGHATKKNSTIENNWFTADGSPCWGNTGPACDYELHQMNIGSKSMDGSSPEEVAAAAENVYDARVAAAFAQAQQQLSWSSLSAGQQALVSGGAKAWGKMTFDARANFDAITHALGTKGLSEMVPGSATMRGNGREMNVRWKPGAAGAFLSTHKFFETYVDPFHVGALVLHQKGVGVRGMEMVFPTSVNDESQAHIDYRSGLAHLGSANDDVVANEEEYRRLYGPLPGVIP